MNAHLILEQFSGFGNVSGETDNNDVFGLNFTVV